MMAEWSNEKPIMDVYKIIYFIMCCRGNIDLFLVINFLDFSELNI